MNYDEFFRKATNNPEPYPYQKRLATSEELPQLIDVPTGCGKTAAVVLGWLWRKRFGIGIIDNGWKEIPAEHVKKNAPRRLLYCALNG